MDMTQQPLRGEAHILAHLKPEPMETATLVTADDGYELAGWLVREDPHPVRANLVINSGTGTPKEFYLPFARFMARQGIQTLVYDYRGIGGSRPRALRGFGARMQDWGRLDMPAAVDHMAALSPDVPTFVLGHSVGGQLLGLMPNHEKVRAAFLVATSTGYWGDFPKAYGAFAAALWYGVIPLTTSILGYAPAKKMRLGEDLPGGVAREWGEWCKRPSYFADLATTGQPYFFDKIQYPMWSLGFADDPIANPVTIAAMNKLFAKTPIESEFIVPRDIGRKEIGHFGFFSRKSETVLWPKALAFFERNIGT